MKVNSCEDKDLTDVELAAWVCDNALNGLTRWDGVTPAIRHSQRIVSSLERTMGGIAEDDYTNLLCVGWLHDIVEDSETTFEDLHNLGFNANIVDAVCAITKREGEDYVEYIQRVGDNPYALAVKVADIIDNIKDMPDKEKNKNRIIKYKLAILFLVERAANDILYYGYSKIHEIAKFGLEHG